MVAKIRYTIEPNGRVTISRANLENDPILGKFLVFLAGDTIDNPQQIQSIDLNLDNSWRMKHGEIFHGFKEKIANPDFFAEMSQRNRWKR